ncbi:hypothetical protein Bbelb_117730, partial [Branchiostoma belcheri]
TYCDYTASGRDIIRNAVNAGEHDAVIFVGSGCTGAIHKLIHSLHMKEPPVVFVGPFEHHSNLLPWREIGSRVMRIAETNKGLLDLEDLEAKLKAWQSCGCQLIGAFSAASNVTGILTDTVQTSVLLHKYGAIAVWDYASAGIGPTRGRAETEGDAEYTVLYFIYTIPTKENAPFNAR